MQVQEYKESLKRKAEERVLKGFPETIVELNEILETPLFKDRNFNEVHQELNIPVPDPIVLNSHDDDDTPSTKRRKLDNCVAIDGTKVMALPTGSVPCNKHLLDVVQIVKPHIRRLIEDSNLVR